MVQNKQVLADVLKKAIKGEEDGYYFYNLLFEKATNPEARNKLKNLRDDEIRHKETLHGLYAQYVGGEIGQLPEHGINALRKVFQHGRLKEEMSEMEFINLAIEAELAATEYYTAERETADGAFRTIFDQLASEEHHHFELLQAEKDALAGNYNWFGYGDGAPLED